MGNGSAGEQSGFMVLYAVLTILLLPAAAVIAIYASRIRFSKRLVAKTVPAQSCPERCRSTIVVAGDSTAFGVGALPAESTAGRLAAAYPHARVINVARSGARIGHVLEQLEGVDCKCVDLILIQACANDVLEFRSARQLVQDLRATIARAKAMSRNVVLMPGHNFGVAPFFLRGISRVISWHGQRLYKVATRVAAELGVTFVDLLAHQTNELFAREPRRYYCPDLLHPSGDGYALWFATLVAQVPLAQFLSGQGSD